MGLLLLLQSYITIKGDKEVAAMIRSSPRKANAEMNRAFKAAGGIFYRAFEPRLRGQGIKVRRKKSSFKGKRKGRSPVFVPVKARVIGFYGKLFSVKALQGKTLKMGTGNPIMIAHEFGATIRPKRGRFLKIRISKRREARKTSQPRRKLPFFIQVTKVVIKPKLGFYATWRSTVPQIQDRMVKSVARLAQRLNLGEGVASGSL